MEAGFVVVDLRSGGIKWRMIQLYWILQLFYFSVKTFLLYNKTFFKFPAFPFKFFMCKLKNAHKNRTTENHGQLDETCPAADHQSNFSEGSDL